MNLGDMSLTDQFLEDKMSGTDIIYDIVFMLFGVFFLFFGWKMFKVIVFLSGFALGFLGGNYLTVWICQQANPTMLPNTVNWIALVVGIIVGLPVGALAIHCKELGAALIGGLFGIVAGQNLDQFIRRVYYDNGDDLQEYPEWATWITLGLCFIMFAILAVKLLKPAVIIMTSCTGSYAVLRGFGELSQTWPVFNRDIHSFDAASWGYLIGCIVLALVGITTQCKYYGHVNHSTKARHVNDPPLLSAA